jgi:hypothetical protein
LSFGHLARCASTPRLVGRPKRMRACRRRSCSFSLRQRQASRTRPSSTTRRGARPRLDFMRASVPGGWVASGVFETSSGTPRVFGRWRSLRMSPQLRSPQAERSPPLVRLPPPASGVPVRVGKGPTGLPVSSNHDRRARRELSSLRRGSRRFRRLRRHHDPLGRERIRRCLGLRRVSPAQRRVVVTARRLEIPPHRPSCHRTYPSRR